MCIFAKKDDIMVGKNKKFTAMNIPVALLAKLKALKKANLAAYEKSLSYEEIIEGLIDGVRFSEPVLYKYYQMIYKMEFQEEVEEPVQEVLVERRGLELHEAICEVLRVSGRRMSSIEIADAIQKNGLCEREDGLPVPSYQVAAKIKNHPSLFLVDRSVSPKMVSLKKISAMKLHEAMVEVLKQGGRPMKAAEIAEEINRMELYERGDGQPVPGSQISARAKNYPHLFNREGAYITLA